MPFVKLVQEYGADVDFMIEAKAKDQALLKLVDDLGKVRGIKRISGGAIELK
jgi:UV DNA damage endonuclease